MGYGNLSMSRHGWAGGAAGGEPAYDYGWPSGGTSEPNVAAQWLFDEGSGNIVDEVSGITLVAQGTPDYSQAITGSFAGLSPGIGLTATTERFVKGSAEASLNLTGAFVIEAVVDHQTPADTNSYLFSTWDGVATDQQGVGILYNAVAKVLTLFMKSETNVIVNSGFAGAVDLNDGPHKLRIAGTLGVSAECFVDGVSKSSVSLATLSGETVAAHDVTAGGYAFSTNNTWGGDIYELRITVGNATNNSGGPGGG